MPGEAILRCSQSSFHSLAPSMPTASIHRNPTEETGENNHCSYIIMNNDCFRRRDSRKTHLPFPQALSHERNIGIEAFRPELDCAFLLCTHVSCHQQLCYFETVVKTLFRLFTIKKALNKITVL